MWKTYILPDVWTLSVLSSRDRFTICMPSYLILALRFLFECGETGYLKVEPTDLVRPGWVPGDRSTPGPAETYACCV